MSLLLVSFQADAAIWKNIAVGDKNAYRYDSESVQRTATSVRVWWREVQLLEGGKEYNKIMNYTEFNCAERTSRDLNQSIYSLDGSVIKTFSVPSVKTFVAPETIGERLENIVCSTPAPVLRKPIKKRH